MHSMFWCGLLGFAFIMVMTLAIQDLPSINAAADPVSAIITNTLGGPLAKVFLALVVISMLACSLVNMTGASRVLFAMSRDERFIGFSHLEKVSKRHVPAAAIWLVAFVAAFFLWSAESSIALYGSGAVLFALFYLTTVLSFAFGFKKLAPTDGFSLGRWHPVVVTLASAWLIIEICILTIPRQFHSVTMATGGVLIVGVVLYLVSATKRVQRV
jgi:amino acid transporter